MSYGNAYALSLSGDAFGSLKNDFDMMLRRTLSSMEQKEAEEGSITIKLGIKLQKEMVSDPTVSTFEAQREIIKPRFDHKVSAVIQYKDEKSGTLCGEYELVWDKDAQDYLMLPITDGQQSIFDRQDGGGYGSSAQLRIMQPGDGAVPSDDEENGGKPPDAGRYEYEQPEN